MNPHILHQKKEGCQAFHKINIVSERSATGHHAPSQLCPACYTAIHMNNSTGSIFVITMENTGYKCNSYHHSHREAVLRHCKSTPCIVSKKELGHKGGQR